MMNQSDFERLLSDINASYRSRFPSVEPMITRRWLIHDGRPIVDPDGRARSWRNDYLVYADLEALRCARAQSDAPLEMVGYFDEVNMPEWNWWHILRFWEERPSRDGPNRLWRLSPAHLQIGGTVRDYQLAELAWQFGTDFMGFTRADSCSGERHLVVEVTSPDQVFAALPWIGGGPLFWWSDERHLGNLTQTVEEQPLERVVFRWHDLT